MKKEQDDAHAATLGAGDEEEVRVASDLLAERIPAVLGDRYRVGELLGSGSFGSVFKAVDDRLQKVVAVKLLDVRWAQREKDFERFRQEALAASRLNHANIVVATDFAVLEDGRPYMVMEFVEGETLEELIKRDAPLSIAHAISIARTLCNTLSAAHGAQIIHRDLKPANVIVGRDVSGTTTIKILDFGMAKLESGNAADLTNTGRLLGTPSYMAPEQVRDMGVLDGRADLYAVGVILYEMLTRTTPFGARTVSDVLVAKVIENPTPISEHRKDLPRSLDNLIMRAINRRPDRRPASAQEMERSLGQVLSQVESGKGGRSSRGWVGAAVAVLAVAAAAAIVIPLAMGDDDKPAPPPVESTTTVSQPVPPPVPVPVVTPDASLVEAVDAAPLVAPAPDASAPDEGQKGGKKGGKKGGQRLPDEPL